MKTECDYSQLSDAQTRACALDPSKSFIVRAPAGSGKTTLLVSRFIGLLSVVEQPEEVLSMTFTRKAKAEMEERILEILSPDSTRKLPTEAENRMVDRVRKRSEKLGWDLHNQPSRLQIMTIDGLASRLIRAMPWASRFGSVPGVCGDTDEIYHAAAVSTLEMTDTEQPEFGAALRVLYRETEGKSARLLRLLVDTLQKRDQWMRILLREEYDADRKIHMEQLWRSIAEPMIADVYNRLPPEVRDALQLDDSVLQADQSSLAKWREAADEILTDKGEIRRRKRVRTIESTAIGLNAPKVFDQCRVIQGLAERLHELREFCPDPVIGEHEWEVLNAVLTVLQVAVGQLKLEFRRRGEVDFIEIAQQAEWALGSASDPTDLALVLDYRFNHILVDEFQDTSISQKKLLLKMTQGWQRDDGRTLFLVGDPMQSIYRFRDAEIGIFLSAATHGLGAVKPIPLQLKRNFRSDSKLVNWFNAVFRETFPEQVDISKGSVNYGESYSEERAPQLQFANVRLRYKSAFKLYGAESTSIRRFQSNASRKFEAMQVVSDIKKYLARFPADQVAVLVRNRSHAAAILKQLKAENMRYYASDIVELASRMVVRDLLSLTRSLLNLADRAAWLSILRAPWCGLTLADLLIVSGDGTQTIWARLNSPEVVELLSCDGRQRLARVRDILQRAYSVRGRLSVRQWVEDTWVMLGGPACIADEDLVNAELLLNLIEQNSRGSSIVNLDEFSATKLDRLYAMPDTSEDAAQIQVSTIHSAKGLEYDAVFIPRAEGQSAQASHELMVWSEIMDGDAPVRGMIVSPLELSGDRSQDRKYRYIRNLSKQKTLNELARLAYVACTRAKKELYIYAELTSAKTKPRADSLLGCMWAGIQQYAQQEGQDENEHIVVPPVSSELGPDFRKELMIGDGSDSPVPDLHRLPSDWTLPESPTPVQLPGLEQEAPENADRIDFDWAGSVAVWTGLIVHEWMRLITLAGTANWSAEKIMAQQPLWKQKLLALGLSADDKNMRYVLDRIRKSLINVLSDERGRWLLDDSHAESQTEYRLTGYVDGSFRNVILDRTFVDSSNTRWVVDYKTGVSLKDDEAEFLDNEVKRYHDQMVQYKKIVAGFDSRTIRTGLYFPMYPAWRELEI